MNRNSIIERLVKNELENAACWVQYLSELVGNQNAGVKICNIMLFVLSIIGAASASACGLLTNGWQWTPTIIFVLIAFVQIFAISNKRNMLDDDYVCKLNKLHIMYIKHLDNVSRLNLDMQDSKMDAEDFKKRYFAIKESLLPIEELKCFLGIKGPNMNNLYEIDLDIARKIGIV